MTDACAPPSRLELVGRLLRRARLAAELSQKEAAARAGISRALLARSERGAASLTLPHLELLSRIYGVPITRLLEDDTLDAPLPADADEYVTIRRKMIGVLLRQARLAHGKSLNEYAEAIGYPPERLAAVEFGEADIPLPDLERLADLSGVLVTHFADPDLVPPAVQAEGQAQQFAQMPEDVREFIAQPSNVLYIRVAMLLSQLSAETLRQIGEGLLDITL
ncbi:MAG: helix-turn-helix transcriptional regulator [Anaerolineae bacterium]|nr:helix-turn-helix transcriptional regulator [Anaerolineae bacterium]